MGKTVQIIVPVRNEEGSLDQFSKEMINELSQITGISFQICFIEDSSTDRTLEILRSLARSDQRVSFYSLDRGLGQTAAVIFALSMLNADAYVMMDGDGSHPPPVVKQMILQFLNGADIAQGSRIRFSSKRSAMRNLATVAFQKAVRILTGTDLSQQQVYFRLINHEVRRRILSLPRIWCFLRLNSQILSNLKVAYVPFEAPERSVGQSKYHFRRLAIFAFDGILSITPAPRLYTISGVLVALLLWAGTEIHQVFYLGIIAIAGVIARHLKLGKCRYLDELKVRESRENIGSCAPSLETLKFER